MGRFKIPKPDPSTSAAPTEGVLPVPRSQAIGRRDEKFVSSNPDSSAPPAWRAPLDGATWKKGERGQYNVFLSPPQKQALDLVAALNHSRSVQEFLMLRLEQALLDDLRQFSDPAVGGRYSTEAQLTLEYLLAWGDQAVGRKGRGQH